jgi:hypothetical protein
MNDPTPLAKRRDQPIEGAGAVKRKGDDIRVFQQNLADRFSVVYIECRTFEMCCRAEFLDQMSHAFEADPALVDEQAKPKIVDLEMPNACDQLLKLNLLACDGDELGQRFFSRGYVSFNSWGQLMTAYQAVKPPSMTKLAPVM